MTKSFNRTIKGLIIFWMALHCLILMPEDCHGEEKTVAVVFSRTLGPYEEAFDGFKKEFKTQNIDVSYEVFDLQKDSDGIKDSISNLNPDVIFAIGTAAALYSKDNIKKTPIVFSMVLNPGKNGVVDSLASPGKNITGVSLDISIDEQFDAIKRIKPDTKKIGMLYDAQNKKWLKLKAEAAAKRKGIGVLAIPVHTESKVLDAVRGICDEADFLWAAADPLIYNSHSAKHILLITLREKKPFMAFSSHYVKAGALMALECDYSDVGRQAAEMAGMILGGEVAGVIPVRAPRKTRLVINNRTARTIGLDIPKHFRRGTDEVVEIR